KFCPSGILDHYGGAFKGQQYEQSAEIKSVYCKIFRRKRKEAPAENEGGSGSGLSGCARQGLYCCLRENNGKEEIASSAFYYEYFAAGRFPEACIYRINNHVGGTVSL